MLMKFVLSEKMQYAVEKSEKPKIQGKQSLVKVKACGICGSDLPRVFQGKTYHFPLVIGHEFSGVIEDSYDKSKIGKKVCVFPIKPCFICKSCKEENYANCVGYDYYGSRCDGGMQDYVVCDDFNLIELDDTLDFPSAAMIEPCAVCLHAVKKANLTERSVLRVYGAGTIGLLCCMWAKSFGVKNITVVDPDDGKAKFAQTLGFQTSPSDTPDVVIDASGAGKAVADAISALQPLGKIVLVGNAFADITLPIDIYSKILRKQLTLVGSWNSDYRHDQNDWTESAKAIEEGKIEPKKLITHTFPLKDAAKAFDAIKERKETFNKVMVVMEDEK